MKKTRQRHPNIKVVVVGILIGAYLLGLLVVAYFGQQRFMESLLMQERLAVEKQALVLDRLLTYEQLALREVAASLSEQSRSSRRPGGVIRQQEGDSELHRLGPAIDRLASGISTLRGPVYDRLLLTDPSGKLVFATDLTDTTGLPTPNSQLDPVHLRGISFVRRDDAIMLRIGTALPVEEGLRGHLVAEKPLGSALQPFFDEAGWGQTTTSANNGRRRSALIDANDMVVAQSHSGDWSQDVAAYSRNLLEVPVRRGALRLTAIPGESVRQASTRTLVFLAAIALIALPLLFGAMRIWRLNNRNLVLRTRFKTGRQQHLRLREQNRRLRGEIDRRVASETELAHQANYDQLTGLPNRNLALDRLEQAIKWAKREDSCVLVLFIDLDRFKQVNDSLGHAAGDDLLREAARRLQCKVRDRDTVSRLGGDEFLVICTDVEDPNAWRNVAQLLLKELATPFEIGDHEFFIGGSIGIAAYPGGGEEPHRLLKNADIAMYAAKERGRNGYALYDPTMDAAAVESMRLERNLRHALDRDEMHLVYQPIVDLSSGRTVAIEALLRWRNDELGDVSPARFIPVAEETGLIHEIGEWVLREACHQLSVLQTDTRMRVAVNLSAKQFSRPSRLLDCVLDALRNSGLMPEQLEIEITESILIDDRPETVDLINQLDRIGVRLALDDFGTGFSALNYLQRFPFDVLKIDRTFTNQVPDSSANVSLIRAIIAMAHALGLEVIAEGIESRQQAGFLLVYHCEFGQGYLYSEALSPARLIQHLSESTALTA